MRKLKNLKHIFTIILISLVLIFTCIRLFTSEFTNAINGLFIYRTTGWIWQDAIYRHTLNPNKTQKIQIVAIDDATLDYFQSQNKDLDKEKYTNIIEILESSQVKWIGIDIIFGEADNASRDLNNRTKEEMLAHTMRKYNNIVIATQYDWNYCENILKNIKDIRTDSWEVIDRTSIETMPGILECPKRLGGIIWFNYNRLDSLEKDKYRDFYDKYEEKRGIIARSNGKIQKYPIELFEDNDYRTLFCQKDSTDIYESCLNTPRSVFKDVPWWAININSIFSRPGTMDIGNMPYSDWKNASGSGNKYIHTLPLELYRITGWDISSYIRDVKTNLLNPYFGPEYSYPYISFRDVLKMSKVNLLKTFADTYVFIGNTRQTDHDFFRSPVTDVDLNMSGVEIHANFLDGLFQRKMLKQVPEQIMWEITGIITLICIILYYFLPKFLSPFFAIVIMIGTVWISRYTYDVYRYVLDIFLLFLAGGMTFFITFTYRFFIVDREKRFIENAFGHYIDPAMVKMIDTEEAKMTLGGVERDLTIFFSDIAGFTNISERLPPKELFWLMIHYLSRMTVILKNHWWTLDKYIGDAVMGFFWAPISQSDHAIRACRTALAMRDALPTLNKEIAEHWLTKISFRIGIASGKVMVGNIGSEDHFNYTVLGDTVNLASRLEACGKEYDVGIIISEWTRTQIGERFELRELDTIAVKWKSEWVRIYEILGPMGDSSLAIGYHNNYRQALKYYRMWKYIEAGKIWESQMNQDGPSRVMALRCVDILKWKIKVENGIYQMSHK